MLEKFHCFGLPASPAYTFTTQRYNKIINSKKNLQIKTYQILKLRKNYINNEHATNEKS